MPFIEYHWDKSSWTVDKQIKYLEKNWSYFVGFGSPLTAITLILSPPYSELVFSIGLPLYVTMASSSSMHITEKIFQNDDNQPKPLLDRLPIFTPVSKIIPYSLVLGKKTLPISVRSFKNYRKIKFEVNKPHTFLNPLFILFSL